MKQLLKFGQHLSMSSRKCFCLVIIAASLLPHNVMSAGGLDNCLAGFKLALDIGHFESKPGSYDVFGRPELEYNRVLSRIVEERLNAENIDVIVIKDLRGLKSRPKKAACLGADLFLSLHHDSVPDDMKLPLDWNGKTIKANDKIFGYTIYLSSEGGFFPQALEFAKSLSKNLANNGVFSAAPHQSYISDPDRILLSKDWNIYDYRKLSVSRNSQVPAVLLEAGFLSNPHELKFLNDAKYQEKIGQGIVQAIKQYCGGFPMISKLNEVFRLSRQEMCKVE